MNVDIEAVVAIVSTMIVLPSLIVGAILGSKWIKYRQAELDLRREELELQKKKLEFLTAEAHRETLERLERDL